MDIFLFFFLFYWLKVMSGLFYFTVIWKLHTWISHVFFDLKTFSTDAVQLLAAFQPLFFPFLLTKTVANKCICFSIRVWREDDTTGLVDMRINLACSEMGVVSFFWWRGINNNITTTINNCVKQFAFHKYEKKTRMKYDENKNQYARCVRRK